MASLKAANPPRRVHPFPWDEEKNLQVEDDLNNPSAEWLTTALDVLLSSYTEVLKLLHNSRQYCLSEDNSKRTDRCLEDLVKLVDICIEVKGGILEVEHYDTLVNKAIRCLNGIDMSKERATSMLAKCIRSAKCKGMLHKRTSISRLMVQKLGYLRISPTGLFEDVQSLNECTAFVLKSLLKALPVEKTAKSSSQTVKFCSLVNRFYEKLRNRTTAHRCSSCQLYELNMADDSVRRLYNSLAKEATQMDGAEVKEMVKSLKKWEGELEKGIYPLTKRIQQLYTALINTRMALLDCLTYSI